MRILFVSVAFPPKSDPEALQTSKYFYHLQKHNDLKIDVVTSAIPTLYMPYDKDLELYAAGIDQLIPVKLKENRYLNYIIHKLGLQDKLFPDFKHSFHKQYKKVLATLNKKPDLIYSRSFPLSSALMAYKLKKELRVPFILHLSDPWADCPLEKRQGMSYQKHNEWERKCFEAADVVTLTSLPTIQFYEEKYPQLTEKFQFFPNVYESYKEEGSCIKKEHIGERKFRIVYTGGLTGERSPSFLIEPLKVLFREAPALAEKMEVIFAGDVDAVNRQILRDAELPFVNWVGKLSFKEALELQRTADLLVVIDNPIADPGLSMFFPSKLLDYMVARKRILAITTRGSATHRVMEDLKGDVHSHNEKDGIRNSIVRALEAFEKKDMAYLINDEPPQKYEASYNADRLYKLIVNTVDDTKNRYHSRHQT